MNFSFVDDTNWINTNIGSINTNPVAAIQQMINIGSSALEATGGALVPHKYVAQVIIYKVRAQNQWKFRCNKQDIQLTMTSGSETVPLCVSNPDKAHKALGTYLCRNGQDIDL